jgi:hypothetical protein
MAAAPDIVMPLMAVEKSEETVVEGSNGIDQ